VEGGVSGDNECAGNTRQIGRQTLSDAIDEIFLLGITSDV
jgi:hypothetical protein